MQPYFFPYIGYWQLTNLVDEYIIYDDVNYIQRGWINRNNILVNGMSNRINLHIKDASQNRLIKDTIVMQSEKDTKKLLATIKCNYKRAPYFEQVYELVERILTCEYTVLSEYLAHQIKCVCNFLGIQTKLILSSEIDKDSTLKGEDKIIDICKRRSADCYINAIGGKELYNSHNFAKNGIELRFLKTGEITYKQFSNPFVPNLSIIDVMMFNSVEQIKDLLQVYTLEE